MNNYKSPIAELIDLDITDVILSSSCEDDFIDYEANMGEQQKSTVIHV